MSRGGRGGGRGGRGARRNAGAPRDLPWETDPTLKLDPRPSELFPAYDIPNAAPLTATEDKQVSYFLLFREQFHDGPLYTQNRTWSIDPGESGRTYGQEQANKRYGVKSKATVDPFVAVPTYSQRFNKRERALPDLAARPFAKEFFPDELHATLDGHDGMTAPSASTRKDGKKALHLSSVTQLRTAEEVFGIETQLSDAERSRQAIAALDRIGESLREDAEAGGEAGGDDAGVDEDANAYDDEDADWASGRYDEDLDLMEEEQADPDEIDDEDAGDYNAEHYFEGNQEDDDDYDGAGGGDDGDGTF